MSIPINVPDYEKGSVPLKTEGADGPSPSRPHGSKSYTNGTRPASGVAIIGMGKALVVSLLSFFFSLTQLLIGNTET